MFALLATLLLTAPLHAQVALAGSNFGTYVSGPKLGPNDLQGKVVLYEYWGVHCPPCLASIPHLAELQAKYGRDNFIIIANHCQQEPADTVNSTWHGKGGGDQITVMMDGELAGANVTGIPRCFLFDHTGKLIYDGFPSEVADTLDRAMKATPGALVAGHDFKKCAKQAAAIGAMKGSLAATIKSLRTLASGTDEAAKDEASWLLAKLETFAKDGLQRITEEKSEDPLAAGNDLARLLGLFKGDELGKPFEDLVKELKADKDYQRELRAAQALASVIAQAEKIGLGSDPDAHSRKQALADISAGLQQVEKSFPDTAAAKRAVTLATSWGL
jgi:thiol-disulfide isomerase/thioredoxin